MEFLEATQLHRKYGLWGTRGSTMRRKLRPKAIGEKCGLEAAEEVRFEGKHPSAAKAALIAKQLWTG